MPMPSRILVIVGSVRPNRICPVVAEWVASVGRELLPSEFEIVDLRDWPLPMDGEPSIPATGDYRTGLTRAWSEKIASGDAIVFVSPQYNWGYPAVLKNALDHLYREWSGKPAMIVTYGGHGGNKCAAQLHQVLTGLKMTPVDTMPGFTLSRARIEANAGEVDPATEFADGRAMLERAFVELGRA
ncbi:NAD(P)H-dependent oxidoreductase [Rhizobium sp. SYY.PMSO]|uniref:NADPH-dependent FMN reductase n=1 Tax=Rhizobium sp. SYY.PMSO TaxID=3382192 RepID=UPI000DD9198D